MEKILDSAVIRFLLAVLILLAIGFIGYYFGFLGFIYNVMIPGALSNYNLVILSIIFGIAAFFSPCAFTVLPAYVSNYLAKEEGEAKLAKALYFGLIAALGIITVNVIIGILIGLLGAATPFAKDPREDIPPILAIRAIMGAIIAIMGFLTLTGRELNLQFIQNFISKMGFGRSMYFYGIVYNAAAIGCTGPILLGLMLYSFASGSFAFAITAFTVFSLTMGLLMVTVTALTAIFKQALISRMVRLTPLISKLAGAIMILAGLAIVILTIEGNNIFVEIFFPYLK
jgi:cytochrome c-type biogenesis protein